MKRAESEFSGRRELRIVVRVGAAGFAAGPWALDSVGELEGMVIWYSFMIWSAVFRRSEDRRGDRFLICFGVSIAVPMLPYRKSCAGRGIRTVGFFLNIMLEVCCVQQRDTGIR